MWQSIPSANLLMIQNWEECLTHQKDHPEGCGQAGEMGWQELQEVQQRKLRSCAWGRTTCLGMVSLAEKTMGVLGNMRLNMNKKFALAIVGSGLHQARYCQQAE